MKKVAKEFDIYKRVFQFASRVEKMILDIRKNRTVSRNSLNQLLSSSSGIGSNLEEARAGQSKADFHAKVRVALKEARESHYWLRLIANSGAIPFRRFAAVIQEANEIVAILTTIAKRVNPRSPSDS